ncbi:MAG: UDP-N-acetylmuramate--L-alanine ligase [Flavobacteriaceae bacterium]|nr:UDP-N-acetylmuramate--L-alanine ligase [Flavobacteriaceae bacterium]
MHVKVNIPNLKNKLQTCNQIYFVGIGGIGMSALAKHYLNLGFGVAGYDKTLSKITQSLTARGAQITDVDNIDSIPNGFLNLDRTLVVYTPAISNDNTILNHLKNLGFELFKRADILGEISKNSFCFAVAGTHGKTTTSTMLGHILKDNGIEATSFLGGISENYNSNLIEGNTNISVVEADEFDKSFLKLKPNIACITSTDADHLDIYGNKRELENSFNDFANLVTDSLFVKKGLNIKGKTFALNADADFSANNIRIEKGSYLFDVVTPCASYKNIALSMPGEHNVLNALAALTMANTYGVSLQNIAKSLKSFRGIKRRFSFKIKTDNLVVIDDYAHHPTEINAVYKTLKRLYPNEEILAVFQPHLFSRTRDFLADFAASLSQFDNLLLLDIYPAREKPILGITSATLLEKIRLIKTKEKANYRCVTKGEIIQELNVSKAKIVLFIGAGDIGTLVEDVVETLKNKIQ